MPIQDELVIYQSEDGNVKVDVLFQDETVWLTQEQMAMLFAKGRTTITEHIANIFSEGELNEEEGVSKVHSRLLHVLFLFQATIMVLGHSHGHISSNLGEFGRIFAL